MSDRLPYSRPAVLCLLTLMVFLLIPASPVFAAPTQKATSFLHAIDWGIIAVYLCSMIGLGWYFSGKQNTTQEYFIGSGQMNPLLIGVSLFATLLSTISYLSMPGEMAGKGPTWMLTTLAYPFVFLTVAFWLLPVYMRQKVTSAYELLEAQLGLSVRLLGAGLFLALRLVWMSLLIYLTAKALTVMMGVGENWIPGIVLVTGIIAVIYTTLGGMRAVVITDLIQCILLYGGALTVIGVVTYQMEGFGWIPSQWHENWDTQPLFSIDPGVRMTVIGAIANFFLWQVCTSGGDQTSIQRFMSTKDLHAARWAIGTQMFVATIVNVTLALVGLSLLGYFTEFPDLLPRGLSLKADADELFPMFIARNLPIGISGLVVSAMFAAAMSSLDSGVNSITAVVMTDIFDRFGLSPKNEREHVLRARWLAFTIGAVVVVGSSQMGSIPGNITAVTAKTSNLLTTPIFCLFFFALFVPFSTPIGVWSGAIVGITTAVCIAFSGPISLMFITQCGIDAATLGAEVIRTVDPQTGQEILSVPDPISFQWMAPTTLCADLGVGLLVSWLTFRRSAPDDSSSPTEPTHA